jgi:hypothetical protein
MYFKTTKRGVQADGGLAAGVAMLACLVLVGMATIQPRGLFAASSRAGDCLHAPAAAAALDLPAAPTATASR